MARTRKALHKISKHLLHRSTEAALPTGKSSNELAQSFSDFFIDKVRGNRNDITSHAGSDPGLFELCNTKFSHGIHPSFRRRGIESN